MSRRAIVLSIVGGVVVIALAGAAIAAIFLRAEVTGGGTTGEAVAFNWTNPAEETSGTYAGWYAVDSDSDGLFDAQVEVPLPLVCDASFTDGVLDVQMTGGWLPGEACIVTGGLRLSNPSSVDIDVIAWSFGSSNLGLQDEGSPIEVWLADTVLTGSVDAGLPAIILAGEVIEPGILYFFVDDEADFDTAFVFDGTAIVGETTR